MAENLAVNITADTTSLRAQLAIAKAEVQAYAAEVRKAAGAVVGGDANQLGNLEQLTGKLAAARGEVSKLTSEVGGATKAHEAHASAVARFTEHIAGMSLTIREPIAGLRELSEVLGVAFAVEKVVDFVKEMAEAAERVQNLSFAVGIEPEKYSQLSTGFQLGGGDVEAATRALITLQTKLAEAAADSGKARDAFLNLGIPLAKVKELAAGPDGAVEGLHAISDAVKKLPESGARTDALADIFSKRQVANIAPLLRKDWEELQKVIEKTGASFTKDQVERFGELAEKGNEVRLSLQGLLKDAIDPYVGHATKATEVTAAWIQKLRELNAVADKKIRSESSESQEAIAERRKIAGGQEGVEVPISPKEAAGGSKFSFNPTPDEAAFLTEARRRENASGNPNLLHYPAAGQSGSVSSLDEVERARVTHNSHAFGLYGFEPATYREVAAKTGLSDISEPSQNINALELFRERGKAPWPWAAAGGEGAAAGTFKSTEVEKDLNRQIKALEEWAKVEAAGYDVGIQKARKDGQEATNIEQQKIEMLQRAAAQEQAIRDQFARRAIDHGDPDLAEKFRTSGGSLQEKELQAQRQQIALQQRADEEQQRAAEKAARLDISKLETQRKGADQGETTDLRRVEGERRTGDLTIEAAAAAELAIVDAHARKVAAILAQEQQQAAGIEKLQIEVTNRAQEEYQKEQEARQRIKDKAQEEEAQRAHAVDAELANAASGVIVNTAWGKGGGIGQQISGLIQGQEKKALDAVGTKLLDASGVGKIFDSIGTKLFSFLPGAAAGAATEAPVVAAITAQTAALTAATTTSTAAIVGAVETSGALQFAKPEVLGTSLLGGGVIPSAAGGMTVNDGRGGTLAILHPKEMVLPSHLSTGIQDMIGRGGWSIPRAPAAAGIAPSFGGGAGGGGGAGDNYHVSISAFDGHSVERMLINNHAAVAKAFSRAVRSNNPNVPG